MPRRLFGSDPFEHLIGELRLATIFKMGGELLGGETAPGTEEYLTYKQKRRVVLCAVTLSSFLRQFESGDEEEFEADMHREAAILQKAPIGVALIWTCGYIYEHKGLQALGGIDAVSSNARQAVHQAAANMRVATAAIKTYRAFRADVKGERDKEKEKEKGKEKEKEEAAGGAVGGSSGSSAGAGAVGADAGTAGSQAEGGASSNHSSGEGVRMRDSRSVCLPPLTCVRVIHTPRRGYGIGFRAL